MSRYVPLLLIFLLVVPQPVLQPALGSSHAETQVEEVLSITPNQSSDIDLRSIAEAALRNSISYDNNTFAVILKVRSNPSEFFHFGLSVTQRFKTMPFVAVQGSREAIFSLESRPDVETIIPDMKVEPDWLKSLASVSPSQAGEFKPGVDYPFMGRFPTLLNQTASLVEADKLWQRGITGRGVVIAILDTGIDETHPNFQNDSSGKVIVSRSFVPGENASDIFGHGTAVASIAAGTGVAGGNRFFSGFFGQWANATIIPGTQRGIAPDALIMNLKVIGREGFGLTSWIAAAVEWAADHGADVINLSLGGPPVFEDDPLEQAVREAVRRGTVVVGSAGNGGPGQFSVSSPGVSPYTITVGAAYSSGKPVYFGSRGPTPYHLNSKPDLLAPGAEILIASSSHGFPGGAFYHTAWGSSFSSSHVAGAAALLLQAFPGASPQAVAASLIKGAQDLGLEPSVQGAGLLNASRAYGMMSSAPKQPNEVSVKQKVIEPEEPPLLKGTRVLVTAEGGRFSTFAMALEKLGAKVVFGDKISDEFDVWAIINFNDKKRLSSMAADVTEFMREGKGILFLPGRLGIDYSDITGPFGVGWRPYGTGIGGTIVSVETHSVTSGVSTVYFPAVASSPLAFMGSSILLYDQNFLAGVARGGTHERIVAFSSWDFLTDSFVNVDDNLRLGINSILWLTEPLRAGMRDTGLGLIYPPHGTVGSQIQVWVYVRNFGIVREEVKVVLDATDQNTTFFSERKTVTVESRRDTTVWFEITLPKPAETTWVTLTVKGMAEKEFSEQNNAVETQLLLIPKNARSGPLPIITSLTPLRITSSSPPYLAVFPGDFNLVNITAISSGKLVDAVFRIEGDVSSFASFLKSEMLPLHRNLHFFGTNFSEPLPYAFKYGKDLTIGNELKVKATDGYSFAPVQIMIPSEARSGPIFGTIRLYNGTHELASVALTIEVREPKATLLYDDVFDYYNFYGLYSDAERLWGGIDFLSPNPDVSGWWRVLAKEGYKVLSLRQVMYTSGTEDPWKIILGGGYDALIIHDKEQHSFTGAVWKRLLDRRISLITNFDIDFPGILVQAQDSLLGERSTSFGIITSFYEDNPVSVGLTNSSFFGGVGLRVFPPAEVLASAVDLVSGSQSSSIVAASLRHPNGAKQVAIGDSNLFEYLEAPDFQWLILFFFANKTVTYTDTAALGLNMVKYATNKPPSLDISLPVEVESGTTPTITINSDKVARFSLKILDPQGRESSKSSGDGRTLSTEIPPLKPGHYLLTVTASDSMGDKAMVEKTFRIVDRTPPAVSILSPIDRADTNENGVTIVWTSSDSGSGILGHAVRIDDRPPISVGNVSFFTISDLPLGNRVVVVEAVDNEGNRASDRVAFSVGRSKTEAMVIEKSAVIQQLEQTFISPSAASTGKKALVSLIAANEALVKGDYGVAELRSNEAEALMLRAQAEENNFRLLILMFLMVAVLVLSVASLTLTIGQRRPAGRLNPRESSLILRIDQND